MTTCSRCFDCGCTLNADELLTCPGCAWQSLEYTELNYVQGILFCSGCGGIDEQEQILPCQAKPCAGARETNLFHLRCMAMVRGKNFCKGCSQLNVQLVSSSDSDPEDEEIDPKLLDEGVVSDLQFCEDSCLAQPMLSTQDAHAVRQALEISDDSSKTYSSSCVDSELWTHEEILSWVLRVMDLAAETDDKTAAVLNVWREWGQSDHRIPHEWFSVAMRRSALEASHI